MYNKGVLTKFVLHSTCQHCVNKVLKVQIKSYAAFKGPLLMVYNEIQMHVDLNEPIDHAVNIPVEYKAAYNHERLHSIRPTSNQTVI